MISSLLIALDNFEDKKDMSDSAVLDVSGDTSASDSELSAPGVLDLEAPPLLMEPHADIAVQVDAPMKQFSTMETYVTYRVRCACARWPTPQYVRRRYNHFKVLRARLAADHPHLPVPVLPPLHSARQQLDRYAASFVTLRTYALHAFLDRVARHPILTHSEHLRVFVTAPVEALERSLKTDGGALRALGGVLSALGPAAVSTAVRVKEPEFSSAAEYLQSLQHKLGTLASLTTRLTRQSRALGDHLEHMKPICDAWCSHERWLAPAVRAAGAGAAGAGAARAAAAAGGAAALLPQLAAYAGAVRDKILERDALHNACLGPNNSSDMQNRLDQFSEALRSELTDWQPKTKEEIKRHLLDMADKQLVIQQKSVRSWETALRACQQQPSIDDLFKTVAKTALSKAAWCDQGVKTDARDCVSDAKDLSCHSENGGKDLSCHSEIRKDMNCDSENGGKDLSCHSENGGKDLSCHSENDLLCDSESEGLNGMTDPLGLMSVDLSDS